MSDEKMFINDNVPILKINWERFQAHVDLSLAIAQRLIQPFIKNKIEKLILLSEGCANSNFKIEFSDKPPLLLRIYVRDKSALQREISLCHFIGERLPISQVLYADESCNEISYPFALMEWMEGSLMREIILTKDKNAIRDFACEAGVNLAKMRDIKFNQGGFFQKDLIVRPFSEEEEFLPYLKSLLNESALKQNLGEALWISVNQFIEKNAQFIPDKNSANLTHGDYDPANMLVKQVNGRWHISAILDWEFALSSSYLLDMGLFLRYSERLPAFYEEKFVETIESESGKLPENWKISAKLMDLLCLLQLLFYNPADKRPNLNQDVIELVRHIVRR